MMPLDAARRARQARGRHLGRVRAMIDRRARALAFALVGLDVDGVLTDGGIYLGDVDGERAWSSSATTSRTARHLLPAARRHPRRDHHRPRVGERAAARARARIDDVAQDPSAQKLPAFRRDARRHGIRRSEAAFVGDDFPDLAVLRAGRAAGRGRRTRCPRFAAIVRAAAHARRWTRRGARVRRAAARRAASGRRASSAYVGERVADAAARGRAVTHGRSSSAAGASFRLEREALADVEERLGDAFARAVEMIAACDGTRDRRRRGQVGARSAARSPRRSRPRERRRPSSIRWRACTATSASSAPTTSPSCISKSGEIRRAARRCSNISSGSGYAPSPSPATHDSTLARHARRGARRVGARGGLSARPRADDQHHGGARDRRRARGGAARAEGIPPRGFRAAAPRRRAGPAAAHARRRCDGHESRCRCSPPGATMREAVVVLAERRGIVRRRRATQRRCWACSRRATSRASWSAKTDVLAVPVDARHESARRKVARADELASAVVYRMETVRHHGDARARRRRPHGGRGAPARPACGRGSRDAPRMRSSRRTRGRAAAACSQQAPSRR